MDGAVAAAEPRQPTSWRCWLQAERSSMTGAPRQQQQQQQTWDRPFWAALALLLVACVLGGRDVYGGATPLPSASTSITISSHASTGTHASVRLHSSVASVDLAAGKLALDLHLRQYTTGGGGGTPDYCEQPRHLQPVLLVGSTAAPEAQLALPLCRLGAEHSATLVLPLQQQSHPHPLDTHAAELQLALAPSSAALLGAIDTAGHGGPDVSWTASWAAAGLQLDVARHSSLQARLLEAAAHAGGTPDGGGWGSGLGDALLPGANMARGEVVMALRVRHSTWVRVVHLTATVLQLLTVGGCCLLVACQCLCAYLMQRLMCNRVHGLLC